MLVFALCQIVEAQNRTQIVYKNRAGANTINPSYNEPLPVHDSTKSGYTTLFNATLLDNAPTADTTDAFFVGDKKKVGFTFYYNETDTSTIVSGALKLEVSPNGTTWYAYDCVFDGSGTDGPVATISYTSDATDYFYLPEGMSAQYVRAILTGTGTTATLTIAGTLIAYWQK